MPSMSDLYPVGYGLKRVNPQPQYLAGANVSDISTAANGSLTAFSARGSMTAAAGTWQTVLDVTGSGYFDGAALANTTANAVAAASGLRITIDGTAFEVQTSSSLARGTWATACDINYDNNSGVRRLAFKPLHIPYSTSLKVEVLRGSADAFAWAVWHAQEF